MTHYYVACDFGAESGRIIQGALSRGRLQISEVHRFQSQPVQTAEGLAWDIAQLYQHLIQGLHKVGLRDDPIMSVSCDSWGVDYMLFEPDNSIIAPIFHYRDPRSEAGMAELLRRIPWETVYAETGVQKISINTLFQLAAEKPKRMARASRLLSVADGFNFLLSGVPRMEVSMASTTQLYNPATGTWSRRLADLVKLPAKVLPEIVPSGTILGPLTPEIAGQTGLPHAKVIASCSHDTAAAVAGTPATGENWAYLSTGTWSLMGIETNEPIINDLSRELNFTNEIGYGGSVRFLKNIVGLWIVQECRRYWMENEQEFDYEVMTHLAASAPPFECLINPNDPRFLAPGNMPQKVQDFCRETHQVVPRKPGAILRCVFESLALLYRRTLQEIEQITGRKIEKLYVVGGGTRNSLLNHFTANSLQIPVIIGPPEASAIGSIVVQAIAQGHLASLEEGRKVVRDSFPMENIQPHAAAWNAAFERLQTLLQ